eukprot:NODE_5357_length_686_cov_18.199372_g4983_i0.p1 GENE.NODE_5357_length_686_cov_18.199372_g4983_i0~~NODE_5357_length_686_cov_18.199372_g4983_i0.p1  ORF type:complete len:170 (+),score=29.38 NODE_5357_length_686_cov_18.199372_g4983_i0:59-568(+)
MKFSPLAILVMFLLAGHSSAALPPQTPLMLRELASDVITGYVKDVYPELVRADGFLKNHLMCVVIVHSSEKGTQKVGSEVAIAYWKLIERPSGWVGPTGQYVTPRKGAWFRFYTTVDENINTTPPVAKLLERAGFPADTTVLRLLEPNGAEMIGNLATDNLRQGKDDEM